MKIQIYSDLHNEFSLFEPPPINADLVVLAGDIDLRSRGGEWANQTFDCPVLYVAGNHEFYGGHIDHTLRKMREAAASHVRVLENEAWIWNQTRFLCTTAWTDYSCTGDVVAATRVCWDSMNDFRTIRASKEYRRLRPDDLVSKNHSALEWLTRELETPFQGKTIVITHHVPVVEVAGGEGEGHLVAAYANRWHSLLGLADLWVFGHAHKAVDVMLNGCRVVSNPRGYPGEETGFNASLEVQI